MSKRIQEIKEFFNKEPRDLVRGFEKKFFKREKEFLEKEKEKILKESSHSFGSDMELSKTKEKLLWINQNVDFGRETQVNRKYPKNVNQKRDYPIKDNIISDTEIESMSYLRRLSAGFYVLRDNYRDLRTGKYITTCKPKRKIRIRVRNEKKPDGSIFRVAEVFEDNKKVFEDCWKISEARSGYSKG